MDFDFLFAGEEVEFQGKKYLRVARFTQGYITAVEKEAELPAQVVVIPEPEKEK